MNLCLFDLDDTLLPLDSDHTWGEFMMGLGWVDAEDYRRQSNAFFEAYQAGGLDIHQYVAFSTRPLRARTATELNSAHAQFMQERILPKVLPAALQLVQSHQRTGDLVAMVTATNEFIAGPIAAAFGISDLIAVKLARDEFGNITGNIDGVPSFREGKVERVAQWLASQNLAWSNFPQTTVYSDSMNDLALFERATHPVATNPSLALRALAEKRSWPILQLFT